MEDQSHQASAIAAESMVHILDDDEAVRTSLSTLLRSAGYRTRIYASSRELLGAQLEDARGCLLLDVRLPGESGLELQERLTRLAIGLPVILLTGHGDVGMSVQAMKAGAVDFLTKPVRAVDLLAAVAAATERDEQGREKAKKARHQGRLREAFATLSRREKEVMVLVTRGSLNKQAAFDLTISEATVKIHRAGAMRKMGASSLADLVRMAEVLELHPG